MHLVDVALALRACRTVTTLLELRRDFGLERAEGEVLELALHPVDAEPVRQRRVDVERLLRDAPALVLVRVNPSVRMLWSRSASLISRMRMSFDIASSILRKFSAWRSRADVNSIFAILVRPSTRKATSLAEQAARAPRPWRACPRPCRAAGRRRPSPRRAACRRGCRRPRADGSGRARPRGASGPRAPWPRRRRRAASSSRSLSGVVLEHAVRDVVEAQHAVTMPPRSRESIYGIGKTAARLETTRARSQRSRTAAVSPARSAAITASSASDARSASSFTIA